MSGCREALIAVPGFDLGFRESGATNPYTASGLPGWFLRQERGLAILRLEIPLKSREFFAVERMVEAWCRLARLLLNSG